MSKNKNIRKDRCSVTSRRNTREQKVEATWKPAEQLQPKTENQYYYMNALKKDGVVIATGLAGTGKTYIPARMFAEWLVSGDLDKIVLSRPACNEDSKSLGAFKGTLEEKFGHWVIPILDAVKEVIPPSAVEYYMKPEIGKIVLAPLETIKGRSFSKAGIIVDEAEDLSIKEVKTCLTRIGESSTMVLSGDIAQCSLRKGSGLKVIIEAMKRGCSDDLPIAHVDFDSYDDIVRSGVCRDIIKWFDQEGL